MTMHLIKGVQVHGNSARKKKKLTDNQLKKLEVEWRRYNKDMRRNNMHSCQFDTLNEYVQYVQGKMPKYKPKQEFKTYEAPKPHVRNPASNSDVKTSNTIPGGQTPRKEPQQYTGDLLVGIGVMHKSNLVPIMRGTDEAKDIANMRR